MNSTGLAPIIDTHVHFWNLALPSTVFPTPEWQPIYQSFGPTDFLQAARPCGVTSCVFVEAGTSAEFSRFMRETAASSDAIAAIVPFVDLSSPKLSQELAAWRENPKVKAVRARFEGHADRDILTQSKTLEGLKQVAAHGLAFEFLISSYHLLDILKVYAAIPELKGVIEHLGKPDMNPNAAHAADWFAAMKQLSADTPVHVKLSLSPRGEDLAELVAHPGRGWQVEWVKPFVQYELEQFHPTRLMWGSDFPLILMQSNYPYTLAAMQAALGTLTPSDERALFHTTAQAFYGI